MSNRATELAAALIRNFNDVPLTRLLREPQYDSQGARLARGTAAQKPARVKVVVASVMQPTVEYGYHPNASL